MQVERWVGREGRLGREGGVGVADESLRERRFLWGPRQPSGGSGGFPLPVLLSDFEMSASAVLGVDTDLFGELSSKALSVPTAFV